MPKRAIRPSSFSGLLVVVLALAFSAVGCPCVNSTINSSDSLRWWLFSNFGASHICPEMLKRGVAIKLAPLGTASVGRFFPAQCQVQVNDPTRSIIVIANGTGYATLPLAQRVGFYAGVSVEYRPDFRLEDDAMYVWGRFNRLVAPPDLRLLGVENPLVNLATQTPLGDVATLLGQGVLASEIGKGFTVVRRDDGDDFTLGILNPPDKPKRQFKPGSDHALLASDVSQLGASTRDYLGPFEVTSNDSALYFKYRITGAPITLSVVPRQVGDVWRTPYQAAQPLGPPPMAPLVSGAVNPGEGEKVTPLAPGSYYIVVENLSAKASAFGLPLPLPDAISYVTYSVELGDRP